MAKPKYSHIRCLYVEDDNLTREEMLSVLSRLFEETFAAADGKQGLDIFLRERPDIVITDLRMPVMGGLEMAQAIRKETSKTEIIVTTAHSDTQHLIDSIEEGINHYVIKPVKLPKLYAAVEHSVETILIQRALVEEQKKKDELLEELKLAIAEIQTLRGFIPICSYCKNVRDDKGYWTQVEEYISSHSGATFSHGVCPSCRDHVVAGFKDIADSDEGKRLRARNQNH